MLDMGNSRIRAAAGGALDGDLTPEFSFFYGPSDNTEPAFSWRPFDVYNYIKSDYAKLRTEMLRSPMDSRNRMAFLHTAFDFVTFAGVFKERAEFAVMKPSGYVVFHLVDVDVRDARKALKAQVLYKTVLLFTDVFGTGLVWVVKNDSGKSHIDFWRETAYYIYDRLGFDVEINYKTLAAPCFLPHDRNVYIGPEYLNHGQCFVNDFLSGRSGCGNSGK